MRGTSHPPEHDHNEDDYRTYNNTNELCGSEVEQHGEHSAERDASEHKPSRDGNAD